jgi:hypothetical protein
MIGHSESTLRAYTEARVKRLCEKVRVSKNETELRLVVKELRVALREHLRFAKETLEAQASVISVLENRDKDRASRKESRMSVGL